MTASNGGRDTMPCRFCGRAPSPGRPRVPGRIGPICVDCVQAGLKVVRDGDTRPSASGTVLTLVQSILASVCEYCGRRERRTFLGFRRPLPRMSCAESGAVICLDCLDHAGDLINGSYRRQHSG